MPISGRRETFQEGRLDDVNLKFSETRWGTKGDSEYPRLISAMIDADGEEHLWNWIAFGGTGKKGTGVAIIDDKLVVVNEDGDEVDEGGLSSSCSAARLFDELQDLGFSPKKLDKVGSDPSVLDGLICHFEQKKSGRIGDDGTEFSDLLPTAILDEEDFGSGKSKSKSKSSSKSKKHEEEEEEEERPRKSSGKGTSGKARAADRDEEEERESAVDEEEEGESEKEEEEEGGSGDKITDLATEAMERILSDPSEYVNNFNPKKNNGGLTLKEVYIAGVSTIKGKDKGEACNLLRDAKFHKSNAKAGLYEFDAENGIVSPKAVKKGGGKR